jgi:hypothetical protein
MYIIIEWILSAKNCNIVQELDGDESSGNAIFATEEEAENFGQANCAYHYKIVKLPVYE